MTSWSLNCSRMSSQMGVGGSSGMTVDGLLARNYRGFRVESQSYLPFLPCLVREAMT